MSIHNKHTIRDELLHNYSLISCSPWPINNLGLKWKKIIILIISNEYFISLASWRPRIFGLIVTDCMFEKNLWFFFTWEQTSEHFITPLWKRIIVNILGTMIHFWRHPLVSPCITSKVKDIQRYLWVPLKYTCVLHTGCAIKVLQGKHMVQRVLWITLRSPLRSTYSQWITHWVTLSE